MHCSAYNKATSVFVAGTPEHRAPDFAKSAAGQNPFAIILGCADSRVPAELVFDQGLGDLFVIRVAGNVAAPTQLGSIEYAAATFGTPLIVVLGHSNCGAVKATLDNVQSGEAMPTDNLDSIVARIRPVVEQVGPQTDPQKTHGSRDSGER